MINYLDEVLRQVLLQDNKIKEFKIDLNFEQPTREWSARLNRPTLNLFLYDVRENARLRQTQPMWQQQPNGRDKVELQRRPIRLDLHYMLTAWAKDADDEHELLTLALLTLFRTPQLPEKLLEELLEELPEKRQKLLLPQPAPISLMVAQEDTLRNPAEIWSAMDNELRPAIPVVVTLALNHFQAEHRQLVPGRGLRLKFKSFYAEAEKEPRKRAPGFDIKEVFSGPEPLEQLPVLVDKETDVRWTIGGTLYSRQPLKPDKIRLLLVNTDAKAKAVHETKPRTDGRFAFGGLLEGKYNLEVYVDERQMHDQEISVPTTDLLIKL